MQHRFFHFSSDFSLKKPLNALAVMILFWALFDGVISYVTPIAISEKLHSESLMGIIYGTSSISGALFDFLACRIFKNTHYKRLFVIMFAICFVYPLILFKANSFVVYVFAMAMWGIYYDLKNIANMDYVGRKIDVEKHAGSFGVLQMFQSTGYLIAPIVAGYVVADNFGFKPYALAWIFISISICFFIILTILQRKDDVQENRFVSSISFLREMKTWIKLGKILIPVLFLSLFLNVIDAFFWTIGPIFANELTHSWFGGFFMVAYSLPITLAGAMIGRLVLKHGKKRLAFISLFIGSSLLFATFIFNSSLLIFPGVFISSFFIGAVWPTLNGCFADYVSENAILEKEIESLDDFFTNVGYVIGPPAAGIIAENFGNNTVFLTIGACGIVIAVVLFLITPKEIVVSQVE
jgi:MFS family permease